MKRRVVYIALAAVLLVVGINLFTRGAYISGKVMSYALQKAHEATGYDVGMKSLVFNFLPTYVDVKEPYVRGWDKDDPGRSVSAKGVRIYLGLAALFRGEVDVHRVQVNGASLDIVKLPSGGYNIDPLVRKVEELARPKPGEKPGRGVGEVVLFDARLGYNDPAHGYGLMLNDAGMDFRSKGEGRYWAAYNVKDAVVRRAGAPELRLSAKGDMLYREGKLTISSMKAVSGTSSVSASGDVLTAATPVLDLKVEAKADLTILDRLALWKGGPVGEASLKGTLKGSYPALTGKGSLTLARVSYAGVKVDDLKSEITFEKDSLSVPGIKSRLFGGEVEGGVVVDFKKERTGFTSSWTMKDLQSAKYTEGKKEFAFLPPQTVSGKVEVWGSGFKSSDIKASGTIDVSKVRHARPIPGVSLELDIVRSVHVEFAMTDRIINVGRGVVQAESSAVEFGGTVGFDGRSDLVIKGHSSNISEISALIGYSDMQGNLDLTGYLQGNITEPEIFGKAQINGAKAHGIPFQSAYGDVKLSGWVLSFKDFQINQGQGGFVLNGKIAFKGEGASFDNPLFSARLGIRNVDARKMIAIFTPEIPINLRADGEMSFDGTSRKFKGEARLSCGAGDVFGQPLDKGEVQAVLSEKDITFPKVVAVRDRDIVTASGGIRFDGTFYGKASSARVDIANFEILSRSGVPVKGSFSVSVTGDGSFRHPDIRANVTAYKLYLGDVDLGAGSASGRIRNDVMTLTGNLLEDKVLLDGFLSFDKPYHWRGRLAFDNGRFEPFIRLVYKKLPEDASLVSTGSLVAEGAIDEPAKTSFSVKFSKLKASILGRRFDNVGDVDFEYSGGKLSVKALKLKGEKLDIEVTGGAAGLEQMDLAVRAKMDLDPLKRLVKDSVDFLEGTATGDMRIRGTLKDPVINGRIRVAGGGLKLKDFQQRFDNIEAAIELEGSGFKLTSLSADIGGGKVTAQGGGGLKGFAIDNFAFDASVKDVRVKYISEMPTTIDAELNVEGVENKRAISGEVTVRRARYTERIDWKSWLVSLQKTRNEPPPSGPAPLGETALNLHIVGTDSIRIDNNVAKIPVSCDLFIRGTVERPILLGRFESAGGSVYFRNNEFRLVSAAAEFADPKRLNPILDLQAETKVKEYQIQLNLTGTLDKLKVSLLSDPPLDDVDILTLLTLGRTSEGLKGHESAITTGEAASFVTGQIQDAVESRVRRITGFDRFQIDPYLTSSGTSAGPRVTVGKSLLSDKLYITYSSNLGTSEDQFVRLEYIFNKNLSLVGERDELARYGGDLKFRFEFK